MEKRIALAGREYRLRYTVNALCAVEERAGGSLDALAERQFSAVRLLLWGGLLACQPEATLEGVGEMMDAQLRAGGSLEEMLNLCAEALEDAGFLSPPAR